MTDKNKELLQAVTGLGEVKEPTKEHHEEAQRLIDDPTIPKSDLRGRRDMSEYGKANTQEDNPDGWDVR